MRTDETVVVAAPPDAVFAHVSTLDAYPAWLRIVHDVEPVDDTTIPTWMVELRARVGPFARSKRLRMCRTEIVANESVVFERSEIDGREHAMWRLQVDLEPVADGTLVTMRLAYDGSHWSGPVLERVLGDEVRERAADCPNWPPVRIDRTLTTR